MDAHFAALRSELRVLRHRYLNGDTSAQQAMDAKAQEAADYYNQKARAVAKRLGVAPRLTTAGRLMRSSINQ
jgi:hypothetical protein